MTTQYIVAVSENPNLPVGSVIGIPGRERVWVGSTVKPDGSMGDLTAIRGDLLCVHCWQADESVKLHDHHCPNAPEPEPWTRHPDQLDLLEGLTA